MWRMLELFLDDWWPIRQEARNFERLATMPVRIEYSTEAARGGLAGDLPRGSPESGKQGRGKDAALSGLLVRVLFVGPHMRQGERHRSRTDRVSPERL